MQWCEAVVHTTTIGSDIISEELMMLGAAGTEINGACRFSPLRLRCCGCSCGCLSRRFAIR